MGPKAKATLTPQFVDLKLGLLLTYLQHHVCSSQCTVVVIVVLFSLSQRSSVALAVVEVTLKVSGRTEFSGSRHAKTTGRYT